MAATADSIMSVVEHRLRVWGRWDALVAKHGAAAVNGAMLDTGIFYAGAEEIGSSDAAYMVDMTVRSLGEPSIFEGR